MIDRVIKVNELIRQELGKIFAREIELPPDTFVTIIEVVTDADLRHARVSIGIIPDSVQSEVFKILKKQRKDIQHLLNRTLNMQHVPQLHYRIHSADDEKQGREKEEDEVEKIFDILKNG